MYFKEILCIATLRRKQRDVGLDEGLVCYVANDI